MTFERVRARIGRVGLGLVGAGMIAAALSISPVLAQQAAPTPAATPTATPAPPPSPTATPSPSPTLTPAPGATPAPAAPSNDSSTGQTLDLTARPAALMEGKASWDDGFAAITGSFALINGELAKAGLKPAGRPIAVFVETDDSGFKYRAMVPVESAPEGKTSLSEAIKLGQTPAGKAMRFEHRGSYQDIDATYEAITAYLDERGIEAGNLFVEEYLNEVKAPDDPNLQVDIFVLLK